MNNKKKMALGAVFVVAIMALAGIGYATALGTYKGTTDSSVTDVDVDYVIISLNGTAYTNPKDVRLAYDTETAAGPATTYKCQGSDVITHEIKLKTPDDTADKDTFVVNVTVGDYSDLTSAGYALYYSETEVTIGTSSNGTPYDPAHPIQITVDKTADQLKDGLVVKTLYWFVVDTTGSIYTSYVTRTNAPPATVEMPGISYEVVGTNVVPSS